MSIHLVSLHRIPSYSSSVPWASILLVPIFYGASILLITVSCGYFMDFPENYKRKGMWLSIIPTNSNFLSPHRLISFSSSPYLTNDKRTICWFPGHMLRPKHVGGVWRLYSKPSGIRNSQQSEQSQRRGKVRQSFFSFGGHRWLMMNGSFNRWRNDY